jgi:hypothetical protein
MFVDYPQDLAVSDDGGVIAFTQLDEGSMQHVYVHTTSDGKTQRLTDAGGQSPISARRPAISGNGRYVAFADNVTNKVLLYDRTQNVYTTVSQQTTQWNPMQILVADNGTVIYRVDDTSSGTTYCLIAYDGTQRKTIAKKASQTNCPAEGQSTPVIGTHEYVPNMTDPVAMTDDGKYVAFGIMPPGSQNLEVRRYSVAAGMSELASSEQFTIWRFAHLSISDDGNTLSYSDSTSNSSNKIVYVMSTHQRTAVQKLSPTGMFFQASDDGTKFLTGYNRLNIQGIYNRSTAAYSAINPPPIKSSQPPEAKEIVLSGNGNAIVYVLDDGTGGFSIDSNLSDSQRTKLTQTQVCFAGGGGGGQTSSTASSSDGGSSGPMCTYKKAMRPAIDDSGRYVAFASYKLGTQYDTSTLLLLDRTTNTTVAITNPNGQDPNVPINGLSPWISGKGNVIVFLGQYANDNKQYLIRYDRPSNTFTKLPTGAITQIEQYTVDVGTDGRWIVYPRELDCFVLYDSSTGASTNMGGSLPSGWVGSNNANLSCANGSSTNATGATGFGSDSASTTMDGAKSVFTRTEGSGKAVYLFDRNAGVPTKLFTNPTGDVIVFINKDGTKLTYTTQDSNNTNQIYTRDLTTGQTTTLGGQFAAYPSTFPGLIAGGVSYDTQYYLIQGEGANIQNMNGYNYPPIFIYNKTMNRTTDMARNGRWLALSGEGKLAAYTIEPDTSTSRLYVHAEGSAQPTIVSDQYVCPSGGSGGISDPCQGVSCPTGHSCQEGQCIQDSGGGSNGGATSGETATLYQCNPNSPIQVIDPQTTEHIRASVIDVTGGKAYFGGKSEIIELDALSTANPPAMRKLAIDTNYIVYAAAISQQRNQAYFVGSASNQSQQPKVFNVRLSNFTLTGTMGFGSAIQGIFGAVVSKDGNTLYVSGYTQNGVLVYKFDLINSKYVSSLTISNDTFADNMVLDSTGQYLFLTTRTATVKIDLSTFNTNSVNFIPHGLWTATADDTTAYVGSSTLGVMRKSSIHKVVMPGNGTLSTLKLMEKSYEEDHFFVPTEAAQVLKDGYAYFAGQDHVTDGDNGSMMLRVRPDFTSADTLSLRVAGILDSNENYRRIESMVLDTQRNVAYLSAGSSTDASPGRILKVTLDWTCSAGGQTGGGSGSCGNSICDQGESNQTCAPDCQPGCGDAVCSANESTASCPNDCLAGGGAGGEGNGTYCGNNICDIDESQGVCPTDCTNGCGDKVCAAPENATNCPADCQNYAPCGNGVCDNNESISVCPQDCGSSTGGPNCGNAICDATESPQTCPYDCPIYTQNPQETCGNGVCDEPDELGCPFPPATPTNCYRCWEDCPSGWY